MINALDEFIKEKLTYNDHTEKFTIIFFNSVTRNELSEFKRRRF